MSLVAQIENPPTKPTLTPSLEPLLSSLIQTERNPDGVRIAVFRRDVPLPRRPDDCSLLVQDQQRFEAALQPADQLWIARRVGSMLQHFYVAAEVNATLAEDVATDWIVSLRQYPAWAIQEAVLAWLSENRDKPRIADIVSGCERVCSKPEAQLLAMTALLAKPPLATVTG